MVPVVSSVSSRRCIPPSVERDQIKAKCLPKMYVQIRMAFQIAASGCFFFEKKIVPLLNIKLFQTA
jgi:hypothetical protein